MGIFSDIGTSIHAHWRDKILKQPSVMWWMEQDIFVTKNNREIWLSNASPVVFSENITKFAGSKSTNIIPNDEKVLSGRLSFQGFLTSGWLRLITAADFSLQQCNGKVQGAQLWTNQESHLKPFLGSFRSQDQLIKHLFWIRKCMWCHCEEENT